MPYRYIEEEATADVALEAWGKDIQEVLRDTADAMLNVMIENLDAILPRETRLIELENEMPDLLLFDLLQRLIYYKDAEQLLLRLPDLQVEKAGETWRLRAEGRGEHLDRERHHQLVDVKAVTLHNLQLERKGDGWYAHVVLDI